MITMTFRIKTLPNKELEFAQAMEALVKEYRKETGCRFYQIHKHSELQYSLESEWHSMAALEDHFRSQLFSVLLGALRVLCESQQVNISDGESCCGMEMIESVRGE